MKLLYVLPTCNKVTYRSYSMKTDTRGTEAIAWVAILGGCAWLAGPVALIVGGVVLLGIVFVALAS